MACRCWNSAICGLVIRCYFYGNVMAAERKCQFLRVLKNNNLYDEFQTLELTHCCPLDWTLYLRGFPGHLRGFLFLALGRIPSLIRESPRLNSPNFQQHMTWMFSFKKKYGQKSRRKYQRCEITKKKNPPWVMFPLIFELKNAKQQTNETKSKLLSKQKNKAKMKL